MNRFSSYMRHPHTYVLGSTGICLLWLWGRLPYHNDILVYVYPERSFNLDSLRRGFIPLWNPYITCGIPHLANWQSAFFYPPYWLMNLTGLTLGLTLLALLHTAWAYLGFFCWARSFRAHLWLAALGAFAFTGSAHFIRCWTNLPFIAAASWIPWVFWAFQKLAETPGRKTALTASLIMGLQLLAGYPIFVFYTWVALGLWLLSKRLQLRTWLWAGGAVGFAMVFTLFQWLPFLDFLGYALHGGWGTFPYYLHPKEWLTFLDPVALRAPETKNYLGDASNSIFGDLYFGIIPFLFWVGALAWKKGKTGFWGFLSIGLLGWMAGYGLGLDRLFPQKLFDLLEPSKSAAVFLFASCAFLVSFWNEPLAALWKKPRWKPWILLAALLGFVDLAVLPYRLTYRIPDPYQDPRFQKNVSTIKSLVEGDRILGLRSSPPSVQGTQLNEDLVRKMSELYVDDFLPNTQQVWGLRSCDAYLSLKTTGTEDIQRYFDHGFPYSGDLLDVAGVRLFLLPQALSPTKYRTKGEMGDQLLNVNSEASEELRFVSGTIAFPDRPSILNVLSQPQSGWRQQVYLEKNTSGAFVQLPPAQRVLADPLSESIARPSGSRLSRRMSSTGSGYFVFNESYSPGWRAWVDGQPRPILRSYGLFMAVEVAGSGLHQVDFRYEPASFRLGLFMSLLVLGLVGGTLCGIYGVGSRSS